MVQVGGGSAGDPRGRGSTVLIYKIRYALVLRLSDDTTPVRGTQAKCDELSEICAHLT
jgi:hypothetical protein